MVTAPVLWLTWAVTEEESAPSLGEKAGLGAELALKAAATVAPNTPSSCLSHQALLQEGKSQSPTRELQGAEG